MEVLSKGKRGTQRLQRDGWSSSSSSVASELRNPRQGPIQERIVHLFVSCYLAPSCRFRILILLDKGRSSLFRCVGFQFCYVKPHKSHVYSSSPRPNLATISHQIMQSSELLQLPQANTLVLRRVASLSRVNKRSSMMTTTTINVNAIRCATSTSLSTTAFFLGLTLSQSQSPSRSLLPL